MELLIFGGPTAVLLLALLIAVIIRKIRNSGDKK